MAASRLQQSTSSTDDEEPAAPRLMRRYKVPTTTMAAKSTAKYRLVSKKGTTTKRVKKTVKKTAAKTAVAKKIVFKKPVAKKSRATKTLARPPEPKPRKRTAVDRANDPPPATGVALIARVTSAIERELNQIEIIVGGHHIPPHSRSEAERRARTLASLARTLAIVTELRSKNLQGLADDDDNAMPRDLDEFRDTLARRLESLIADQSTSADCEPEPE